MTRAFIFKNEDIGVWFCMLMGGFTARTLASVDGQIVLALACGPMQATELYSFVRASQPTVSRRLGTLLDQKVISVRSMPDDRRCNIYSLNPISMWKGVDAAEIQTFGRLACLISHELQPNGPAAECCTRLSPEASQ